MNEVFGLKLASDTLAGLFWLRVTQTPDEVGLRFERESFSFAQMATMVNRVRRALRRDGAEAGAHVATFMYNSPWLLAVFLACALERMVFCPINVALRRDDLGYVLRDLNPFAVIADAELEGIFRSAEYDALTPRRLVVGGSFDKWLAQADGFGAAPEAQPGDPLCIIYSGGTTGLPKGIVMPQFAPIGAALRFNEIAAFGARETYFSALQISHAWTPLIALPFCLYFGHTFCFWKRWSASQFVDMAGYFKATIVDPFAGMVATLLQTAPRPEDAALSRVRLIAGLGGMEPVATRLRAEYEKRFGSATFELYGFTEATGLVANETEATSRKFGSSGKVSQWYDVAVVGADDVPLLPGQSGEILVRPKVPFTVGLGYHNKPEVTVATWRNLWIHTGDLGYFDEDGYLFFAGRKSHFLRRKGELVSATEVENVLMSFPGVVEAGVIAAQSDLGEDEVRACVVTRDPAFDPQQLVDFCRERIAAFKVPRYIDVMDSLPRSGAKREIERFRLKERDIALAWDGARKNQ
jgi:crotonobetaine/carnitine-CoA ligase